MTEIPVSFQLTAWIPAWWRGRVGGDEIADLVGSALLAELAGIREEVVGFSAYCPALTVAVLPGPKPTTERAVAAGEATILHSAPGSPAHLLVPEAGGWDVVPAGSSRPIDLDLHQADLELTQAVVQAEHALRESAADASAGAQPPRQTFVRPLPPDAEPAQRALLVRAARIWTAVAAVPPEQRKALGLDVVLQLAARATLAAYACGQPVAGQRKKYA